MIPAYYSLDVSIPWNFSEDIMVIYTECDHWVGDFTLLPGLGLVPGVQEKAHI